MRTMQDYIRRFADGEMARLRGLDPRLTCIALWDIFRCHGEEGLLYLPVEPDSNLALFREWHMHRVLQEFEMSLRIGRRMDRSYVDVKMKHLRRAYDGGGLAGLLTDEIEDVVRGWDYSANYMRIAKSTLWDLRFWYEHHSSYAVLLK